MRDALTERTFARLKAIASGIEEESEAETSVDADAETAAAEEAPAAAPETVDNDETVIIEAAAPENEPVAEADAEMITSAETPVSTGPAETPETADNEDDDSAGEQASEEESVAEDE